MTIRDIARAANVSPATVSMIINKKDSNISQETRDRVLQIIDECGYVPYASIRERIMPRSRTIGLVLPALDSGFEMRFVSVLQRIAREQDYSLVLALTGGSADTERSAFEDFVRNRAEGILCLFGSENCLSLLEETAAQGLYAVSLDHHLKTARFPLLYRDSARIVRECTDLLVEHNCRRIGLVLQPDCPDDLRQILLESYTSSLSDGGLPFQQNFVLTRDAHLLENFRSVVDGGLDAVVCQDVITAQTVYTLAAKDGLRIPEDISVISMEDSEDAVMLSPPLTAVSTDIEQVARTALECLLCQIQGKPAPFSTLEIPRTLQLRSSIRMRKNSLSKIFVAGYLNTDIVLATDRFPQHGQTQVTSHVANFVGGKGANLAYGVAHLGGNVCLAGRLGSDRRGRFIYDRLSQAGVKMDGVSFDSSQPTGTAYISLFPTGSSTVLIDPGANQSLTASDMEQARYLLQDAKYCLLQTDIPMDAVLKLHEMCAESRIPTILCPAYVHEIPAKLLDGLFMLAVTRSEMARIYPQFQTMEEQADYLLNQGVQNAAIVDLEAGCLWATRESRVHFPPYAYPCADKTGMIDVFIASLATLLSENFPMEDAIFASYWACAYGTMKIGVQEGFPDWSVLVSVLSRDITVHPE